MDTNQALMMASENPHFPQWLREACKASAADNERLRAALSVYADPSFYHACVFMFDRPTGGFDEDFDFDAEYDRPMPGKLAREVLGPND